MHMVEGYAPGVEETLRAGGYLCPACQGDLRPWGFARMRTVGRGTERLRLRPRRSRCRSCLVTHVLLPVMCLLRRCDLAETIERGLALKGGRLGLPAHRRQSRDPRHNRR